MPVTISAVGGAQTAIVRHAAALTLSPESSNHPSFSTTALILPSLTSYAPKRPIDPSALSHLSHLKWADSDPTSADPIHVLIGADLYSELLLDGVQKGRAGQPIAQNSLLGWIISGPVFSDTDQTSLHLSVHCTSLTSLGEELKRFWEIEEPPQVQLSTPLEEQCESHFRSTHSRSADGRYVVRLPFKTDPPIDIGHSRYKAERLLQSLIRRFHSQPTLKNDYCAFMRDYADLGHMRPAPASSTPPNQTYFVPHHPVFCADSTTSKIRVVFNASSVTSNGSSLNDHLHAGPKPQLDLPAIILKWRQFRYVYSADVAKMYRQILIDERDIDFQRILWLGHNSVAPCEYQLLTVTYGMTCAPYLALRVLKCLVDDEGDRFPLASSIIRNQIYVDDVLFGDDDISSLRQRRDQLVNLMRCGKFELRKWASNSPALLEDIDPSGHGLACSKTIADDEKIKVLGIVWNPARDTFQFRVTINRSIPESKREILSTIAKLFDPLGWVSPVIIAAKIFMQHLWRSQLTWDQKIPDDLQARWQLIFSKLTFLNDVSIPRWTRVQPDGQIELHGFADASSNAYAAVIYLRSISSSGEVSVSLLTSKSKVAPVTPLTIPRLELSATLLLSSLMHFVITSLDLSSVPIFLWTFHYRADMVAISSFSVDNICGQSRCSNSSNHVGRCVALRSYLEQSCRLRFARHSCG
ncbi:PREDICTED: uncharacterized protein LOC105571146 [Vollenhovia emeryi]|uniref:uncharacterized protein LOC105571146 n=1 Tax=Vollenhovia emeryi TaxID=411798 RepID=UPI0005F4199A|nr:PREDICTED: uncharacterized protein LOC105571146 [Vollenhovia emeryi]